MSYTMNNGYSWEEQGTYEPPEEGGFGWSVLTAVVLALLAHVAVLILWGGHIIQLGITEPKEWVSEPIRLAKNMESAEAISEPREEEVLERPEIVGELVTKLEEILPELQDISIDVSPLEDLALPQMEIKKPALKGEEDGDVLTPMSGLDFVTDMPELGSVPNMFPEAKPSQLVVDSGSLLEDVLDPDSILADLAQQRGVDGLMGDGVLGGFTGLGAYAKMSPGELKQNKATIGSDLLFEFGETTLRDDARLTLMTVAMLIDRNPNMYCWVEGHTDLFGANDYNFILSAKRGQAVKDWLVNALQLSPERIVVRAFGKTRPVVKEGAIEEQAANRRVDIKMRENQPETIRKALVKPGKAVIVEELIPRAILAEEISEVLPRVVPIEESR